VVLLLELIAFLVFAVPSGAFVAKEASTVETHLRLAMPELMEDVELKLGMLLAGEDSVVRDGDTADLVLSIVERVSSILLVSRSVIQNLQLLPSSGSSPLPVLVLWE
jgi:hypothetical protein